MHPPRRRGAETAAEKHQKNAATDGAPMNTDLKKREMALFFPSVAIGAPSVADASLLFFSSLRPSLRLCVSAVAFRRV